MTVDLGEQEIPLTVNAPVIFDAGTEEGVQPLLEFVRSLKHHDNKAVAEKESSRLAPYFSSMSIYLTRVLEKDNPEMSVQKKEALKQLTTPGGLSGIFNAMASCTRNTLISDVAIMPYNIKENKKTADLFEKRTFKVGYKHLDYGFDFGFLQIHAGGAGNMKESSTAFPTFMIDNKMMEAVKPHQPEVLLRELQAVLTFVNHDMLHHFTSPTVNSVVAAKFNGAPSSRLIDDWSRNCGLYGDGYEEWAQIGQERILLIPENAAQTGDICKKLDRYFDDLERIGKEVLGDNGPPSPEEKQKAHEVVDFFGMVMAHALTRVFPLNHPVMTHCLDRLQQADTDPEKSLMEGIKKIRDIPNKVKELQELNSLKSMAVYSYFSNSGKDIVESYKNLGLDILPDHDSEFGYKNLKLLQLIKLSSEDIMPHTPKASLGSVARIQKNADQATLDMIVAAAKTSGYEPKK